jgi:uncharacterized ubiquitin-like protein YukD
MKLTLKTLQGKQLPIEVDGSTLVSQDRVNQFQVKDFKILIETAHQMPADMMKLIFKSKILEDDFKTINDYGVVDGGAIVVMI